MEELKILFLNFFNNDNIKIFLFGSRARGTHSPFSDVDIGIISKEKTSIKKLPLLKEKLENSNIPYKVDIINFSNASESFYTEALKEIQVWKDFN